MPSPPSLASTLASTRNSTLASTLARLDALDENFIAGTGPMEAGWFRASDLTDATLPLLAACLERQAHQHPTMEARTKASYFVGEYVWYVAAAAIAAFLIDRRVPDVSPDNMALRFQRYTWHEGEESGEAERIEVRFLTTRCTVLPHDPLEADSSAALCSDTPTLREHLRTALEAHFAPLIERVYAETKLSRHAQWMLAADSCAALFLHLAQQLKAEPHGIEHGLAFVRAPGSPMNNRKTGYFTLEWNGHCDTFRARGGCCRYYTVSESGEDYCTTCVLRKPEDRDARMLAYMSRKYAQETAP
jgi:ferric iron reductase protein FhuF